MRTLNKKHVNAIKSKLEINQILVSRESLVNKIINLPISEGFDWNDCDIKTGEVLTSYRVEKLNWYDSVIILIGGYGGDTACCCLSDSSSNTCNSDDQDDVTDMVNNFLSNVCMINKNSPVIITLSHGTKKLPQKLKDQIKELVYRYNGNEQDVDCVIDMTLDTDSAHWTISDIKQNMINGGMIESDYCSKRDTKKGCSNCNDLNGDGQCIISDGFINSLHKII